MLVVPHPQLGDLPAPLTPPDCDLSKLRWMPTYVDKVRNSEFWRTASFEIRGISFEFWLVAWHQKPAASLPDNDVLLAFYIGCDIETWRALKPIVMAPWILCADGRFYHPTLAEIAVEQMAILARKDRERELAAQRKAKSRVQKTPPNSVTRDTEKPRRPHVNGAAISSSQKKTGFQQQPENRDKKLLHIQSDASSEHVTRDISVTSQGRHRDVTVTSCDTQKSRKNQAEKLPDETDEGGGLLRACCVKNYNKNNEIGQEKNVTRDVTGTSQGRHALKKEIEIEIEREKEVFVSEALELNTARDPPPAAAAAPLQPLPLFDFLNRLFAAAGPGLADPAKCADLHLGAATVGSWIRAGCDFEFDVEPVVRAKTANPRASPIRSWSYFTQAVLDQRDRRLQEHPNSTERAKIIGENNVQQDIRIERVSRTRQNEINRDRAAREIIDEIKRMAMVQTGTIIDGNYTTATE